MSNVMALQRDVRLAVKEGRRSEHLALHGVAACWRVRKSSIRRASTSVTSRIRRNWPSVRRVTDNRSLKSREPTWIYRAPTVRALRPREDDAPGEDRGSGTGSIDEDASTDDTDGAMG